MKKELKVMYDIQKEIFTLSSVLALLSWDQKTYMPKGATVERSEEMAMISHSIHEKFISKELFQSVKKLKNKRIFNRLKSKDRLIVKKLYKAIQDARKVPSSFVEKSTKVISRATMAWEEAKEKNDFQIFAPWLRKVIKIKREQCHYIKKKGHMYNSLLDGYEEGMTVEKLKPCFEILKLELIKLLNEIKKSRRFNAQKSIFKGKKFEIEKQKKLDKNIISLMGLPENYSRLDISSHPFTLGISLHDVRITTRYSEDNFYHSFNASVHEAGHALYQLGLPESFNYTIISHPASLGIHESQSRFWENMVMRSKHFWKFYFPTLKKIFRKELKGINLDDFYREINKVRPSLIRVDADEVTYCLHIILRFELELDLLEGKLKVKDLPKVWNKKMKDFFGITPKNDREGVLQDTHWGLGAFGYFPTYALGSIYAAQLFDKLMKEQPRVTKEIETGNLKFVLNWLRNRIHKQGNKYAPEELIRKVCNEDLNPYVFIEYLRSKYLSLYR